MRWHTSLNLLRVYQLHWHAVWGARLYHKSEILLVIVLRLHLSLRQRMKHDLVTILWTLNANQILHLNSLGSRWLNICRIASYPERSHIWSHIIFSYRRYERLSFFWIGASYHLFDLFFLGLNNLELLLAPL